MIQQAGRQLEQRAARGCEVGAGATWQENAHLANSGVLWADKPKQEPLD